MAAYKGPDVTNQAAWLIGPARSAFEEIQPVISDALSGLTETRTENVAGDLLAQAFSQYAPQEQVAAPVQDASAITQAAQSTTTPSILDFIAGLLCI